MRRLGFASVPLVVAMFICGCLGAQPHRTPRLVLLYATCSLNRQYLSAHNDAVFFTPNLGRFAQEAAVFRAHATETGLSGTDFASIFAGVQADRHGVFKHPQELDDGLYLIFEAFRRAGFDTFYWGGHPMAAAKLRYAQGVPSRNAFARPLTAGDEDFRVVLSRLRRDRSYRALVVTAFTVTHSPYRLDDARALKRDYPRETADVTDEDLVRYHRLYKNNSVPFQTRFDDTVKNLELSKRDISKLAAVVELAYEGGVHRLDGMFGAVWNLLREYRVDSDAVIAFTADHGETLYREDRPFKWTHGPDLAPEVITVPLMIRWPGVVRPRTVDGVTRSIDVYPTLAGLARVSIPEEAGIQGQNLAPALRDGKELPRLRGLSHGTLRQWSFFVPDLIENIWAAERVGDLLYTWRRERSQWRLDVRRIAAATNAETPLHPSPLRDDRVSSELWAYRERMIGASHRGQPAQARSKEEELGRLDEETTEVLKSLGYIE